MAKTIEGKLTARALRIAVVVAKFNGYLTEHMLANAVDVFKQAGGRPANLTIVRVPGSLELAVTALNLARTGKQDAIVCLGCIIRGETDHYDHVAQQSAKGIREVGTRTGVPCIFGVITADTLEQAIDRVGGKQGNHGSKAMLSGIEMANVVKTVTNRKVARPASLLGRGRQGRKERD